MFSLLDRTKPSSSSPASSSSSAAPLELASGGPMRDALRSVSGIEAQQQVVQRGLAPNVRAGLPPASVALARERSAAPQHGPAAQSAQEPPAAAHHPAAPVDVAEPQQLPPEVQHEVGPAAHVGQPLPAGARPALAFAAQDPAVADVAARVAAYNALAPEATFQDRFAALRAIDSTAYQVFQDHPVAELTQLPFGGELRALLTHTEREHAELVEAVRERTVAGDEGHLPLDATGMGDGERAEASALWSSIARGQGDLRVAGSPAFQKETFGGLAKLMQGQLGRRLVGHLDRRAAPGEDGVVPDRGVTITESASEPGAAARESTQSDMQEVVGPAAGPDADPRELVERVLTGERSAAIGGRPFDFAAGSAVEVLMPAGLQDTRSLDADKNEIVTPGFIALGHELGHAAKAKSGAKGTNVGLRQLPPGTDGNAWRNNPEEYLNVKGVENPLRAEHGMKQRGDYIDSVKRARSDGLRRMVVDAMTRYESQGQFLGELAFRTGNNRLNDDAVYAQLRREIEAGIEQARQAHEAHAAGGGAASSSSAGPAPERRRDRLKKWAKGKLGRGRE